MGVCTMRCSLKLLVPVIILATPCGGAGAVATAFECRHALSKLDDRPALNDMS
jgi:hypothetical protein